MAITAAEAVQGLRLPAFGREKMDIPILIGVPTFVVFLLVLAVGFAVVRLVPILLRKSLIAQANSDSVALMRFAPEPGHDGATQSRLGPAVLLVLS
jgi:hypothetical protein